MQEIADILKILKSIKVLVKMKTVSYFMAKTIQTFWPTNMIQQFYLWTFVQKN